MSNTYDIGNLIRLSVAFAEAGVPLDPTTIQLNVRPSDQATQSFTYAANQVIRDGVGLYHYDYSPPDAGIYYYRFFATGAVIAATDGQFEITDSATLQSFPPVLPACC